MHFRGADYGRNAAIGARHGTWRKQPESDIRVAHARQPCERWWNCQPEGRHSLRRSSRQMGYESIALRAAILSLIPAPRVLVSATPPSPAPPLTRAEDP